VDDVHPEDVEEVEAGVPAEVADLAEIAQFWSGLSYSTSPYLAMRRASSISRL
jgi:hypothetical protein